MERIFISYSREDLDFVKRLTGDLKRHEIRFWIDFQDIKAGHDFADGIWKGLKQCEWMLLVISPASMASMQVDREWKYFIGKQKPIIPVLIKPMDDIHYLISSLQYIDFYVNDYKEALAQLVNRILINTKMDVEGESPDLSMPGILKSTEQIQAKDFRQLPSSLTKSTGRLDTSALSRYEERIRQFDEDTLLRLISLNIKVDHEIDVRILKHQELVVGRPVESLIPDVDLTGFGAEQYGVSRRHASFYFDGEMLFVKDLNSKNRTFVNQMALRAYERHPLKNGDTIQFGNLIVTVAFRKQPKIT
jgi:hypothetical protein